MKRLHVHIGVDDLTQSVGFYSALFAAQPTVIESDYAKWMLDDPRVNFAISQRGRAAGLNHLGLQAESAEELAGIREQFDAADVAAAVAEPGALCCYAKSDKHWVTDPQGIAWEAFHTLDSIPLFGAETEKETAAAACCSPKTIAVAEVRDSTMPAGRCC